MEKKNFKKIQKFKFIIYIQKFTLFDKKINILKYSELSIIINIKKFFVINIFSIILNNLKKIKKKVQY